MKVSILILALNEESNLRRCLAAIDWCDDIIVVDSGSDDLTVAIAEGAGARVLRRPFDNFANQRNFGLDEGEPRHEWVLHLDADEVLTPEFRDRLDNLQPQDGIEAYRIPSKIILHGHWLRYAGMYPTFQVRLGKRDGLRFKQLGHGQREDLPQSSIDTFDQPYLHYNFSRGIGAWFSKHIRYAEDEAHLLLSLRDGRELATGYLDADDGGVNRRRRLKEVSALLPLLFRPVARFLYVLVWRGGFLDGRYGVLYASMLAVYEAMISILATEKMLQRATRRSKPSPGAEARRTEAGE